ncbi:MAG: flagellar protein FlgN [Planctomycetota bacterium]|jgi:hypothetical protein|nr:flagellar protein FlgN [Planctomycetota bacterium]MDA1025121.1 flagellar protein FlgN [Planctomycetota bacterium]
MNQSRLPSSNGPAAEEGDLVVDTSPVLLRGLEETLSTQVEGYRRFLEAIARKRDAIRRADLARVPDIAAVEEKIIDRLHRLDLQREQQGRQLAASLGLDSESAISGIVDALGGERGTKLAVLAAQLRGLVDQAKKENSVVRSATESLARHMAGIVQSVTGALSGTGVYGRQGRLRDGTALASGLDLTT